MLVARIKGMPDISRIMFRPIVRSHNQQIIVGHPSYQRFSPTQYTLQVARACERDAKFLMATSLAHESIITRICQPHLYCACYHAVVRALRRSIHGALRTTSTCHTSSHVPTISLSELYSRTSAMRPPQVFIYLRKTCASSYITAWGTLSAQP